MKKRLDAVEARLMTAPAPALSFVDAIDWSGAPADVLDALEVMQALAATLPADMSAAEKYGQIGLIPEGFDACKTISMWVGKKCTREVKL